jgi:hypothetical protein
MPGWCHARQEAFVVVQPGSYSLCDIAVKSRRLQRGSQEA